MESKLDLISHWEGIRAGNAEALFGLYESLFDHLLNFGIRYSADVDLSRDLVNEIFFEIWDKRANLPDVDNVKSYLLTYIKRKVARYYYHDELKRKAIDAQVIELEELSYEDFIVNIQTEQDLRVRLKNAIKKLTPAQKEIIQLKFFENLNYIQIAELKLLTVKTAYNTVYDALKLLRKEMNY